MMLGSSSISSTSTNTTNLNPNSTTDTITHISSSPNSLQSFQNSNTSQNILLPNASNTSNSNECQNVAFMQHIHNHNNNNTTLLRQQQMFGSEHHSHHLNDKSLKTTDHYCDNRFNCNGQYVDLNNLHNAGYLPQIPTDCLATSMTTNQATTAYLVQTSNGSALLIPSQTALNPTNHFMQTNSSTTHHTLNRNPYGITAIPLQTNTTSNYNNSNITNGNSLINPNSNTNSSTTAHNYFVRPESTASTNVYQTIDAEKLV